MESIVLVARRCLMDLHCQSGISRSGHSTSPNALRPAMQEMAVVIFLPGSAVAEAAALRLLLPAVDILSVPVWAGELDCRADAVAEAEKEWLDLELALPNPHPRW